MPRTLRRHSKIRSPARCASALNPPLSNPPSTPHPQPSTLDWTLNPQPLTLDWTLNPQPLTLNQVGVGVLNVPTLKVGTLDSLMSLSDDLERVDRYVESVVHRLEKEIRNLINSDANLDRETPSQRESRERQVREIP